MKWGEITGRWLAQTVLLAVLTQWPLFLFAATIDGDEWQKSGFGTLSIACVGAFLAAFKAARGKPADAQTDQE